MTFQVSGFQEAIAIVNDFAPLTKTLCDLGGWSEAYRGAPSAELLKAWQLPEDTQAEELLLENSGVDKGKLRLIRFQGTQQKVMRANDQIWDSGGTFDFNVRIASMNDLQPELSKLGWRGWAEPQQLMLGPSTVKEWLAANLNHVRFAFIERVDPPLIGWDHMNPVSHIFNSSQIVQDFDKTAHFLEEVLGFKCIINTNALNKEPGPNVFGFPFNRAHTENYQLAIFSPDGTMDGSIEILKFPDSEGKNYSEGNRPPNLGMLGLRFPVTNIQALADKFEQHQVEIIQPITEVAIAPYGTMKLLIIATAEGAWLEFFELSQKD